MNNKQFKKAISKILRKKNQNNDKIKGFCESHQGHPERYLQIDSRQEYKNLYRLR